MNLESKLKDRENHLTYENVTPEELRKSNYPNNGKYSIWVNFSSENGCNYDVVHAPRDSHIRLASDDKNRSDIRSVARKICKKLLVAIPTPIYDRMDDILLDIRVPRKKLTQKSIASIVEDVYNPNFINVWISKLYYFDVYRKEFENSTLPRFKIVEINSNYIKSNFCRIYEKEINYFRKNPNEATYHNAVCKFAFDEIKNRKIPDIKLEFGNFKFYDADSSECIMQLERWKYNNRGDLRMHLSGPSKSICAVADLISSMTQVKCYTRETGGKEGFIVIFLPKNLKKKITQENIFDLFSWLSDLSFYDFSGSLTYNNLTKDEFDIIAHKANLSDTYALVKNRKLRFGEFISDLDTNSLFHMCTNLNIFKCYFEFVNKKKKEELLRLVIKNRKKMNPDVVDWVNDTQRNLVEDIAVAGVGEK